MTTCLFISISAAAFTALLLLPSAKGQEPASAPTRPAKAVERLAAISSVQAQLQAFRKDDYKTAVSYQSAGMRHKFTSLAVFRTMMLKVYPEFAHSKSVRFGPANCDATGLHLAIPAAVTGQDGITVNALYLLVREGKVYHIEGVAGGAQMSPDNAGDIPGRDV